MAFILIVEDDEVLLGLLSSMLRREGHEVREATSALIALDILETEKDRCDLVLTDFQMKPMNGLQLVNRIVQKSPTMKILFMSAYPNVAPAIEERFGSEALLLKPFPAQELSRKIKKVLAPKTRRARTFSAGSSLIQ
jgi:two-component system cell cycle sensor histidine kinase/response regulator CckA